VFTASHALDQERSAALFPFRGDAGGRALHSPAAGSLLDGRIRVLRVQRLGTVCAATFRRESPPRRVLSHLERHVLEALLLGQRQKEIAFDLGLAITTVNGRLRVALQKLGLTSCEQAVLVAAALASDGACLADAPGRHAVACLTLSARLLGQLSAAECDVVLHIIDGHPYARIGAVLNKSPRTVSNQTASSFRKLGVGSRLELVRRLAVREA
jgi:DNA-binding CsgD family transcriptional regulator